MSGTLALSSQSAPFSAGAKRAKPANMACSRVPVLLAALLAACLLPSIMVRAVNVLGLHPPAHKCLPAAAAQAPAQWWRAATASTGAAAARIRMDALAARAGLMSR